MNAQVLEIKGARATRRSEKSSYKPYSPNDTAALIEFTNYLTSPLLIDYYEAKPPRPKRLFQHLTKYVVDTYTVHLAIGKTLDELKQLEHDWDASGALAPMDANIEAAGEFLRKAAGILSAEKMEEAEINPVPDGSIDVVWRTRNGHLLINFREPEIGIAHFYFDQYDPRLGRQGAFSNSAWLPDDIQGYLKSL